MTHARPRPRRTAPLAVALAAVAALALAGCDDDSPKPDQGSRPVEQSSGTTTTGSPSGSPSPTAGGSSSPSAGGSGVTLLAAGSGSRRVVELDLEKGHEETSTAEVTMSMDLGLGKSVEVPFSMPFTTTVTGADGDGYTADSVFGKPTVDASDLPAGIGPTLSSSLALIKGTTLHLAYGRDGVVTSSKIDVPDDAPDLVARMMDTFSSQTFGIAVPFPAEAVGVGARWRSTTTLQLSGASASVTSTYELVALDADGYRLKVSTRQTTKPGAVAGGGSIVKGSASGTGTVTGRTGLVSPASAQSTLDGLSVVEVGGQRVRSEFATEMRLTTR